MSTESQSTTADPIVPQHVSSFHLRAAFFVCFYTVLFLFYPGASLYTRTFSHHRALFETARHETKEYEIAPIAYIRQDAPQPFVTAQGAYVIELSSAAPLYARNEHTKLLPASTTKVIAALTAIDHFKLDDVLTVERVVDEGQSMGLVAGEKITFENLLYGVLVHSGNDAAYVLADNYPGGYRAFIDAMNTKAQSLHMKDTRFHNPAGLDSSLQFSTAFDLSLAGRELLRNKELSKIVSTKSITVSDVNYTYFHQLINVNRLLGEIPGVAGLKTGKTDLAGENLITLYKHEGHDYLIVLLKSEDRFTDTQTLVSWLAEHVHYHNAN